MSPMRRLNLSVSLALLIVQEVHGLLNAYFCVVSVYCQSCLHAFLGQCVREVT